MHDAQQREEDRVQKSDDAKRHIEVTHSLLVGDPLHGHIDTVFEPLAQLIYASLESHDRLIKIRFGSEIRQDMLCQGRGVRFGCSALDTGGFQLLCIGECVDRHLASNFGQFRCS